MAILSNFITPLTYKVIEKSIEQIDMNDLYFQMDLDGYTFSEFYKAVKETDKKLAKQIDDWFKENTKKQLMQQYSGGNNQERKVVDLTPKPETNIPKPKYKPSDYVEDSCRGGHGWGGRPHC